MLSYFLELDAYQDFVMLPKRYKKVEVAIGISNRSSNLKSYIDDFILH